MPDHEIAMDERFVKLWGTKNKDDEWWSSFVTSPLAILLNWFIVDVRWITPGLITSISFTVALLASALIMVGTQGAFLGAVLLINSSLVLDCMDGQLARYRGVCSRFGSFFDKVADQIKVFVWFCAIGYASFLQTESVTPIFLSFTGVTFYSFRGYMKYLTIFIEVEHDATYLEKTSSEAAAIKSRRAKVGGIDQGFGQNLRWFLGEQRKFFMFNEAVFVFLLSVALVFNVLLPVLWLFAISQLYFAVLRSWQRGSRLYGNQHNELMMPIEK